MHLWGRSRQVLDVFKAFEAGMFVICSLFAGEMAVKSLSMWSRHRDRNSKVLRSHLPKNERYPYFVDKFENLRT